MIRFSAYVPCYNNGALLRRAVESVCTQTMPPAEVIVVDDGSAVSPREVLAGLPVRIVRQPGNLGRGAARARAMEEARHEFVLCCDATMALARNFAERTLPWFEDAKIAGVFGRVVATDRRTAADRWRARHLFKVEVQPPEPIHGTSLITCGLMLRKSAAAAVGGFDARLRHSEDADLGRRLLAAGFDVVSDPRLEMWPVTSNTVAEVLERYWRWYAGKDEVASWRAYRRNLGYAVSMLASDGRARDFSSMAISFVCPHYCFWKSWWRRRRGRAAT